MKKAKGISFEFSFNPFPALLIHKQINCRLRARTPVLKRWFSIELQRKEDIIELQVAKYFGLKIDLHVGRLRRPIARPFSGLNPWTSGKHWFILDSKIPVPGIFVSFFIRIGKYTPGFYVGTKTYRVDKVSSPAMAWAHSNEFGNEYLCPSATLRKDLSK